MVKNNKSTQNSIFIHYWNIFSDSIRDYSCFIEKNDILGRLRLFASKYRILDLGFICTLRDDLNQIKIIISFQHFRHTFFVPKVWKQEITNNRIPVQAENLTSYLHQNPRTLLVFTFSIVFWINSTFLAVFASTNWN